MIYSKHPSLKQNGIALVLVLWILALLSVIALAYSGMTRTESQLTGNIIRSAKAKARAEAGFWFAVHDLIKPVNERRLSPDGSSVHLSAETGQKLTIAIQDESGKIDLNKASQNLLLGLFKANGLDHEQSTYMIDALLDWRDKDNLQRANGAEDSDYSEAGLAYGAKDGTFNSIEEITQIRGMTPQLFKKLKPAITIHSMQARIRLNTAPTNVIQALPDMSEDLLSQIMTGRSDGDTAIISTLLPESAKPLVFTSGQGNVYTIISDAQVDGMSSRLQVTLILKKTGNRPITILDWKEVAPPLRQEHIIDNGFDEL